MKNRTSAILIVGLGSIGKSHLSKSLKLTKSILVVDPNPEVKEYIQNLQDNLNIEYYDHINQIPYTHLITLAIISNWGPDHFNSIVELMDLGISSFIVEKPVTSKISDLLILKQKIFDKEINVGINMPWIHSNFPRLIEKLKEDFELGEIHNISISGGAKCMATTGVHYIGLAISLFKESPDTVFSELKNDSINPRSRNLKYLEGSASWKFPNDKNLSITFSNKSRIQALAILSFEFGRIIIEGSTAIVYAIPLKDRTELHRSTRTHYPQEVAKMEDIFLDEVQQDGTDRIYEYIAQDMTPPETFIAINANESLFAMLISNEIKKSVSIPVPGETLANYKELDWKIS